MGGRVVDYKISLNVRINFFFFFFFFFNVNAHLIVWAQLIIHCLSNSMLVCQ